MVQRSRRRSGWSHFWRERFDPASLWLSLRYFSMQWSEILTPSVWIFQNLHLYVFIGCFIRCYQHSGLYQTWWRQLHHQWEEMVDFRLEWLSRPLLVMHLAYPFVTHHPEHASWYFHRSHGSTMQVCHLYGQNRWRSCLAQTAKHDSSAHGCPRSQNRPASLSLWIWWRSS